MEHGLFPCSIILFTKALSLDAFEYTFAIECHRVSGSPQCVFHHLPEGKFWMLEVKLLQEGVYIYPTCITKVHVEPVCRSSTGFKWVNVFEGMARVLPIQQHFIYLLRGSILIRHIDPYTQFKDLFTIAVCAC